MLGREQFDHVRALLENHTGILLGEHKRAMVEHRLGMRINQLGYQSVEQYLQLLGRGNCDSELQFFIDRLTTHETSFFREPMQFEKLKWWLESLPFRAPLKAWSAACSSGEEAYSLAMVLDDSYGNSNWSLLGTDVSANVVENARQCQYPLSLAEKIPPFYRKRYCLKGIGENEGHFTIAQCLRRFCHFSQHNLLASPQPQQYDVIFLRNVLIYFDSERQKKIVDNVIESLAVKGLLFLGHSENVLRKHSKMVQVENCIYRRERL
ncbi:CheR family methyltransferase [Vibrio sp. TRT 21S02]|uniref:CheR family methyltransferase n=1 Tax=Vibrio sp. TRT 21S02 TaxID=3418507 RepID=UPI003CF43EBB